VIPEIDLAPQLWADANICLAEHDYPEASPAGQVSERAIERYRRLPASNRTGVPAIKYAGKAVAACSGVISAMASMRRLRSSIGSIGYEPESLNDAEGRHGHRRQCTSVSNIAKRHNRAARRIFGSRNRHIAGASERKLPPKFLRFLRQQPRSKLAAIRLQPPQRAALSDRWRPMTIPLNAPHARPADPGLPGNLRLHRRAVGDRRRKAPGLL
jgi:hypothetical protein